MNPLGFVELLPVFQPALIINWNWPDSPEKHCMKYGLTSRRVRERERKCVYLLMERRGNTLLDLISQHHIFIPPLLHIVV